MINKRGSLPQCFRDICHWHFVLSYLVRDHLSSYGVVQLSSSYGKGSPNSDKAHYLCVHRG